MTRVKDLDAPPDFHKWGGDSEDLAGAHFGNVRYPGWEQFTRWDWLPEAFKSMDERVVLRGVDGSRWELSGPRAGYEGAVVEKQFLGLMSVPFEHRWSEGPYTVGGFRERTDIRKRALSFGVVLNPNANIRARLNIPTETIYRNTEARWNRAWSKTVPAWLGVFTRSTGWRWLKVILDGAASAETLSLSPTAYGNNMRQVTMNIVAPDPYFYKRAFVSETVGFDSEHQKVALQHEGSLLGTFRDLLTEGLDALPELVYENSIPIVNRGQVETYPKFLVEGTGRCWIQDGITDAMIPCPEIFSDDGYLMVDTDQTAKTFTTSREPVDNVFYRFVRSAELFEYFPVLHDLGDRGLPAWRRANGARFQSNIPRETAARIRIYHTNPDAKVTAIVSQKYETAW